MATRISPDDAGHRRGGHRPSSDFVLLAEVRVLLDMVYLQQDAFDAVDTTMSLERQQLSLSLVRRIVDHRYLFDTRDEARQFFTQLTNLYKNWNYAAEGTPEFDRLRIEILKLLRTRLPPDDAAADSMIGTLDDIDPDQP